MITAEKINVMPEGQIQAMGIKALKNALGVTGTLRFLEQFDNGGSGGVFAVINPETGIVYTDGIDETGKYYSEHPDSGVKYKGWQVPRWQELCEAVEKAHKNYLPKHHYVGWDWALTDQGWTLIEENWGQFLLQFVEKVGRKRAFLKNIGR